VRRGVDLAFLDTIARARLVWATFSKQLIENGLLIIVDIQVMPKAQRANCLRAAKDGTKGSAGVRRPNWLCQYRERKPPVGVRAGAHPFDLMATG